mgnify:CR=1 FL=1
MSSEIIKAYFDTNSVLDEDLTKSVIKYLNSEGCNVIQSVYGTDFAYNQSGEKGISNLYTNKLNEISNSDIVVIEMSSVSPFLLTLISEALALRKPVLVLSDEETGSLIDSKFIKPSNAIIFSRLYNEGNLKNIIKEFVSESRKKILNIRFTVRISSEQSDTLERLKQEWGCKSKNEVISRILDNELSEN